MKHPSRAELTRTYRGRRVLVTGHTGFKGAWLVQWLAELGAEVHGLALPPGTSPSLFEAAGVAEACRHTVGDIRDPVVVREAVEAARPDFVFHLAAQPLVRLSYEAPVETLATNVMGTAHVLDAVRLARRPCAVVVVTSDKCYENREQERPYTEDDRMGGHDVYSMSKGCAELVASSWRRSFFPLARLEEHGVAVASARAGNVIGGGDWAKDRIVPDAVAALAESRPIAVRNPEAVRPWQHVLEPLGGYLLLGARIAPSAPDRGRWAEAWNFGPRPEETRSVRELVERAVQAWGGGRWEATPQAHAPHEAKLLRLDIAKAEARLGWSPRWSFDETVRRTVDWYRLFHAGPRATELASACRREIDEYLES